MILIFWYIFPNSYLTHFRLSYLFVFLIDYSFLRVLILTNLPYYVLSVFFSLLHYFLSLPRSLLCSDGLAASAIVPSFPTDTTYFLLIFYLTAISHINILLFAFVPHPSTSGLLYYLQELVYHSFIFFYVLVFISFQTSVFSLSILLTLSLMLLTSFFFFYL